MKQIDGRIIQKYILSEKTPVKEIKRMCKETGNLILTSGAIVKDNKATLITGPGTDNLLEATIVFGDYFDGIIGNSNSILYDTKNDIVFNILSKKETREYYCEQYTGRKHVILDKAPVGDKFLILNWKLFLNDKGIHFPYFEKEIGKNLEIRNSTKSKKKLRNFASKASHIRGEAFTWKEQNPSDYETIVENIGPLEKDFQSIIYPIYNNENIAVTFVTLSKRHNKINSHEKILQMLIDENVI